MADHVLERHGGGVGVTEHNHAERIADEDEVKPGFVEQARRRVIVGGERRDFALLAFEFPETGDGVVHAAGKTNLAPIGAGGKPGCVHHTDGARRTAGISGSAASNSSIVQTCPGKTNPGRMSASGWRTKRRAANRGCGTTSPGLSIRRSPT